MKTRSKSARKPHIKNAGRRAARSGSAHPTVSNLSVTPVAQANASGADAVIPVSVKEDGNSAHAVIPVEVATGGKIPRKRAAVIPVSVQKRSARARRHRPRTQAKVRQHRAARDSRLGRESARNYPVPWRMLLSDVVTDIGDTQQAAVQLGVEYGRTAAALVRFLFWPYLDRPAAGRKVSGRRGRLQPWQVRERATDSTFAMAA